MLDFQKIRNKQKWLFALIAIPVIFGFVILFTPDAEDRLFGRSNFGAQEGSYGQISGTPVTLEQWQNADHIAGLIYANRGEKFIEDKVPDVLVELELLNNYAISVSSGDVINLLNDQIKGAGESAAQLHAFYKSMSSNEVAEANFVKMQKHLMGTSQLRRLAGVGSQLISAKEAEIQYRQENEQYEAEAVILSHTNYLSLVQIDDAKLQEYYTNSISKYRLSETRQISYVTFPPTNYLDQAEVKYNELPDEDRKLLLQSCWPADTNIVNQVATSITDLAVYVASVQTNEFAGMKKEELTAQVRETLLTKNVGLKAGLAVIEAYSAGEDFQSTLQATYDAKPELDTLEKLALLQNIEVRTTPPMRRDLPFVPGLQRVTPSQVFALSQTNALIAGASSLSGAGNADPYFIASLKRITPTRNRSFAEAKTLVTEDYKKAESIKLLNEAGEKLKQAMQAEKTLSEIAKDNNLKVLQLGPFGPSGGTIEGLEAPMLAEDIRTQVLGLDTGATSELVSSSTDNDVTDNEVAFIVKLKAKQAVSKETYDKEFSDYLKQTRAMAVSLFTNPRNSPAYTDWLNEKKMALYKYSFTAYVDAKERGTVKVDGKTSESEPEYFSPATVVTVVAEPAPGYVFKEWQGLMRESKSNPNNSVLVIDNSFVTAVFIPVAKGDK